jgi:23S rRNA (pseudouridine1915-N3)-methyltransferase
MKIKVVWVGKTRSPNLASVSKDFSSRIRHFVSFEIVEIKETKLKDDLKRIAVEGQKMLSAIDRSDFVAGLDPKGRASTSDEFASFLEKHMTENPRTLAFVVGGPAGLSDDVKRRSDVLCSLSKLTLSHDLARIVLLEQIYRALTIIRNLPYAK